MQLHGIQRTVVYLETSELLQRGGEEYAYVIEANAGNSFSLTIKMTKPLGTVLLLMKERRISNPYHCWTGWLCRANANKPKTEIPR